MKIKPFQKQNENISKNTDKLPCDDVLGRVEDLIAGFGGLESAADLLVVLKNSSNNKTKYEKFKIKAKKVFIKTNVNKK